MNYTCINYSFITSVGRQLQRQLSFFFLQPPICSSLRSYFVFIFLSIPEDITPVVDWLKSISEYVPINLDCLSDPTVGKLEINLLPGIMLDNGNEEMKEMVSFQDAHRELGKSVDPYGKKR